MKAFGQTYWAFQLSSEMTSIREEEKNESSRAGDVRCSIITSSLWTKCNWLVDNYIYLHFLMLQLDGSYGLIFNCLLWHCCACALVRSRHKNHLHRVKKNITYSLKYLFRSQQTCGSWRCPHLPSKNIFVASTNTYGKCPEVSLKIPIVVIQHSTRLHH